MQRLEVGGAVRPLQGPLGVKGLKLSTCSRLSHFDKPCISRDVTFAVRLLYRILSDITKI